MADVRKLFKGIQQVTQAYFDKVGDKTGYLWFVKRADEADPYGDIYFGGDHYGHYSEKDQDQIAKISQIETDLNKAKKDIEAAQGNATAQDAAIKKQEMAVKKLEDLLGAVSGYEYKEVAESVVPDEVKTGAGVNAKPEANAGSAEFVKVVTGEPDTTTYYQKEVSSLKTVIDAIKTSIEEVKAEVAKIKVKDVAAKDKVLALSPEGVLSSTLSLEYNKEQKKIYLYGKDQTETNLIGFVDTTDFVKDGMLDTAEVVVVRKSGDKFVYGDGEGTEAVGVTAAGKYIRMHFNTDGAKQDIFLSVGEMVAAYTGGKDIKISAENAIDVALSEDITVAGLNDTYGCGLIKNGNTIKAGTSLTEILKQMLSKEINPKASTKPSISISKVAAVSGLHEIGESVSVGTATISKTAGHFNNNGWISPAQPAASFTWSNEKMSSKLTNGAEGYAAQTDVASIAQGTAKTVKGTNKVTITASADYSAPTNKPITNLNKPYDGADATWIAGTATNTATVEWTGVYPCFTNLGNLGKEPAKRCTLQSDATFTFTVPAHNAGNNDFRFAYPDGWTISSFKVKSLDGKYYEFSAAHNKNAGDLAKTIQGNAVTYHYLTVENGASDYQITLNKGLNA